MNKMCSVENYVNGKGDDFERYNLATFSHDAAFYRNLISPKAQDVFDQNKSKIVQYSLNKNPHAINLLSCIDNAIYKREQQANQKIISFEGQSRILQRNEDRRAGFINASILFYAILNIGIIIAVTLIIL